MNKMPRPKVITIRVNQELDTWLDKKALEDERTKSNYVYYVLLNNMRKETNHAN